MENENSQNLNSQTEKPSNLKSGGKVGPFIGSSIIIILIIIGGLYFWNSVVEKRLEISSANSIEKDIEEINAEELDKDMVLIEAELDAALAE